MNEVLIKYFEIAFDIFYLAFIWILVYKMYKADSSKVTKIGNMLKFGFLLLAIGDTGHVGFRVWAYALGGLGSSIELFGFSLKLTGLGSLFTAYLVTVLYMIIAKVWKLRFKDASKINYYFLQGLAIIRLIVMAFPQNQWGSSVIPYDWSLIRNFPLLIMGIYLGYLIYRDAKKEDDEIFKKFAVYIFVSYLFYTPVILWVKYIPMLGMLMIPKTVAYLYMAVLAYKTYFKSVRQ